MNRQSPVASSVLARRARAKGAPALTLVVVAGRRSHRTALPALLTLVLAASCGGNAPSDRPATLAPAIEAAIELRGRWGMRADVAWAKLLEQDPAAVRRGLDSGIGIPVTPQEAAEIAMRERRTARIGLALEDFAVTIPDDWAGSWIDQTRGGIVVINVTENAEAHRSELARLFRPDAPIEVGLVERPLADLRRLADRIGADIAWFEPAGIGYVGVGVDIGANVVAVSVLSNAPDAAAAVRLHYGDAEPIRVDVRPDERWQGGYGQLTIVVTDRDGRPVEGLECRLIPDDERALPDGPSGTKTLDDGTCVEDVGATGYLVELVDASDEVIAQRRVIIGAGESEQLRVTVGP